MAWRSTWFAAPYGPCPIGFVDEPLPLGEVFPGFAAGNQTVRLVVRSSVAGSALRLRLSNNYGVTPLAFGAVTVARATDPDRGVDVFFEGSPRVVAPPGGEVVSDPVVFEVGALEELAVGLYAAGHASAITWHAKALATSYASLPGTGDRTRAPAGVGWRPIRSWCWLTEVQVDAPADTRVLVAVGDSITDGSKLPADAYARWTDLLPELVAPGGSPVGVVNAGIGSNRVFVRENGAALAARLGEDPTARCRWCGPTARERFDADVIGRAGASDVVLAGGLNDLAAGCRAAELIEGIHELAERALAAGVRPIGWTITPAGTSDYAALVESSRNEVNRWIRSATSVFAAVVDAASFLAAPESPELLDPAVDSGDGIHPNVLGHRRIARAVYELMRP